MSGIGLLNEKPLHASLREGYARPGDRFEVPVDGFVIDIVRDNVLLEIQTGNLAAIKSKLVEDLFTEAVHIPRMLSHSNFSLEGLMIREEEARRYDGRRKWRTRGWVIEERRLLEVVDRMVFEEPGHWLALLPEGFEPFTASDLAEARGIRLELGQKMA